MWDSWLCGTVGMGRWVSHLSRFDCTSKFVKMQTKQFMKLKNSFLACVVLHDFSIVWDHKRYVKWSLCHSCNETPTSEKSLVLKPPSTRDYSCYFSGIGAKSLEGLKDQFSHQFDLEFLTIHVSCSITTRLQFGIKEGISSWWRLSMETPIGIATWVGFCRQVTHSTADCPWMKRRQFRSKYGWVWPICTQVNRGKTEKWSASFIEIWSRRISWQVITQYCAAQCASCFESALFIQ